MRYTRDGTKRRPGKKGSGPAHSVSNTPTSFGGAGRGADNNFNTNHSNNQESYDVFLGRRSLQLQTGTVRYDFQHGIPNDQLLSDRRVSITFRQNRETALGPNY